jgi:hypothetical protein
LKLALNFIEGLQPRYSHCSDNFTWPVKRLPQQDVELVTTNTKLIVVLIQCVFRALAHIATVIPLQNGK